MDFIESRAQEEELREACDALLGMFYQYCGVKQKTLDARPMFDHRCMSAGENAAGVLLHHEMITNDQLVRS